MLRKLSYLILLFSANLISQNIEGVLYDAEGKLQNFEVWNESQNIITQTDKNGEFQIKANIGDSIIFNSLTYKNYTLIASKKDFEEKLVIELEIDLNDLEEVNLTGFKNEFEPEKFNKEFSSMLAEDKKKHPYLYQNAPNAQGNLLNIFGFIYEKLIKKRDSKKEIQKIKFKDFKILFETDETLNDNFLVEELKIPVDLKNLYFDYLDSLSWNYNLLMKENRLELIQKLYESSKNYHLHINENTLGK